MIGKTVSHYKILSKLGEGGMGVVYKAEDTRLGRSVALKFLPASLGTQDAAKKRFIHEAKAASSLEHPNICAVYDIGEADDGQMFIAMPHYDGETLQERIARGPLGIGEAIDIVTQLASGLAKAHERGIVHRDIKPGNIFITRDGHVKILDFGLAKLATETRLTKSGMTLGTIAYMSREQASGGDVDARSDIFSMGVVFYELLTGVLPFKGDHEAAIIYGILHNDPEPLQTYRSDVPEGLQRVIDKALAKNVEERCESARAFEGMLAGLGAYPGKRTTTISNRGATPRSPFWRLAPWVVLAGAVLATVLFVLRNGTDPSSDGPPPVAPTYTQVTFTGDATDPVISPDGQLVAYLRDLEHHKALVVKDVVGGEPIVLLDSLDYARSPRWSPDGTRLLVPGTRNGQRHLYIIRRLGGAVRHLEYYDVVAWSPDGRRIAGYYGPNPDRKNIYFIDVTTGHREDDAVTLDFSFRWVQYIEWSTDGTRLLLRTNRDDDSHAIWTIRSDGHGPKRIVEGPRLWCPQWAQSGDAVYYAIPSGATQSLWKVGVDKRTGDVKEDPKLVLGGLTGLVDESALALSSDGKRLSYARRIRDWDLWLTTLVDEGGQEQSKQLTRGTAVDDWPSVSPDGQQIAFVRAMGEASNVFVMPIQGGPLRQITFMDADCFYPAWSPDGREIAFISNEGGETQLWKVDVEEGTATAFEDIQLAANVILAWSPGERILTGSSGARNYLLIDPRSASVTRLLAEEDERSGYLDDVVPSPDATRVALHWNREGRDEDGIYVISLVDSSKTFVLQGHKHPFGWSRDGEWIYYYDVPPPVGRVRPDGSGEEVFLSLPFGGVGSHPSVSMSPDARHFVAGFEVKTPSDIWLIENFDPDVQ